MSDVVVQTVIDAPPRVVWDEVRHIDRHVHWMADAVQITFCTDQRAGVGTTFDTLTRFGPLATVDRLEITEWVDGEVMGVRHTGAVTGLGRFTLSPEGGGTRFCWSEDLRFPWWFGGRIGQRVARPIFTWVWRRNLATLKATIERSAAR